MIIPEMFCRGSSTKPPIVPLWAFMCLILVEKNRAQQSNSVQKVTSLCREVTFLNSIADQLESQVTTALNNIKSLTDEAVKLEFGKHCASSSDMRTKYAALSALAQERFNEAVSKTPGVSTTILNAVTKIRQRISELRTLQYIKGGKPGGASAKAEFGTSSAYLAQGAHKTCTVTVTNNAKSGKLCEGDNSDDLALKQGLEELTSTDELKLTPDSEFDKLVSKALIHAHGTCSNIAQATTTGNFCSASASDTLQDATNAVGLQTLTLETLTPPAAQQMTDQPANNCVDDGSEKSKELMTTKKTAATLCNARKLRLQTPPTMATLTVGQLKADSSFKNIIRLLLGTAADKDDDDKQAHAAVNRLFGSDSDNLGEKFINKLSEITIKYKLSGADTTVKGDAISAATPIGSHIAYCIERNQKALRAQVSAENPPASSKQAEDCKGETDEGKCSKKDGCEYKDGECKAKATTTTGTAGNTTGKNSFVINKAPLFLAFLLIQLIL
uniref:Variant surface glycoprotein 492 n=1 Tax=Trypanosoma brucei TaxID=5691 RepID=M4SU52_9TRYP|nr:variant surface glycoprotein 492 [Trypanosoma brucei]